MSKPKIPFAFDEQKNIVEPDNIQKGSSYFCPNCKIQLQIRSTSTHKLFFVHKKNELCNYNTILLQAAKQVVEKSINDWKNHNINPPKIKRKCEICGNTKEQEVPDKVNSIIVDYKISPNEIWDVVLFSTDNPIAIIEFTLNKEKYDPKPKYSYPLPYIQVHAQEIIENNNIWIPLIDKFKQIHCPNCQKNLKNLKEIVIKISKETNIPLPTSYYRYSYSYCWKCHKEILVFSWPDKNMFEHKPVKQPIPKTIQFRYSKTAGTKYWINTCPYCNSIQGDFFLYGEPDGPFFGFECSEDNPEDFKKDMKSLAYHASYIASLV